MVRGTLSYNAATLLRSKRVRALEAASKASQQALESSPSDTETSNGKPDSPMNVFDQADEFVESIKPKLTQMIGIIGEMKKMAEASTNSALSDEDRKQINVRFVEKRFMIDGMANQTEFGGKKLFNGELMRGALKIPVGIADHEVVEVRFDSLKNDQTGLEGQKIDSLVNARNALKEMDNVLARFQLVGMMFKAKEDEISVKRKRFVEENQIPEEIANARKAKALQDIASRRQEVERLALHLDLKEEQERIAQDEGRERALLINRKI
jgi:hypothetical protein